MKTTLSQFRKVLYEHFQKKLEDVDRERRMNAGYDESPLEVDYGDLPEDADRLRRAKDKYGETEFEEDYELETDCPLPEGGGGEEEEDLELEKRGQEGKLSAEEEKYVMGLKKAQAAGKLPKVNPKTGEPTNIYAIAKAAAERNEVIELPSLMSMMEKSKKKESDKSRC